MILPGGATADAVATPVGEVLGWLVAAGAGQAGDDLGSSVRWLGRVAIWAVELTARGAIVPLLRQRRRGTGNSNSSSGSYSVRWTPALIDPARLTQASTGMPGSVLALDSHVDRRALTRSALTGMVGAICRDGARRLEVPRHRRGFAPPPTSRRRSSPASTAARSTPRCASRERSPLAANAGPGPLTREHAPARGATRSSR